MNTMKAIIQYLDQQYDVDVRVTLEYEQMFVVPVPKVSVDKGVIPSRLQEKKSVMWTIRLLRRHLLSMLKERRCCK